MVQDQIYVWLDSTTAQRYTFHLPMKGQIARCLRNHKSMLYGTNHLEEFGTVPGEQRRHLLYAQKRKVRYYA